MEKWVCSSSYKPWVGLFGEGFYIAHDQYTSTIIAIIMNGIGGGRNGTIDMYWEWSESSDPWATPFLYKIKITIRAIIRNTLVN